MKKMTKIEEDQYTTRFNIIKEKNTLIKKFKKDNKPLLLFNSMDNEKPVIDISSMLFYYKNEDWNDRWKYAYFGDLVGSFENYNEKCDFNFFMSKIIIEIKTHDWRREFEIFLKWISEIWILLEGLNDSNILNTKSMKIYKFECPDFIVNLNNQEIWGIEVTHSETDDTQWLLKNSYAVEKEWREKGLEKYLDDVKITSYKSITRKNIENIDKHFSNNKKYQNNIQNLYPDRLIKIFYFITLGGAARFTHGEQENLNEIKLLALNHKIAPENVFVQIGHKTAIIKWLNLNEIFIDLDL